MPNQGWADQLRSAEWTRWASGRCCDIKPFHPAGNPSLGFIADMRKMRLQLVGGRAVQCGQIARQQCHKGVYAKSGQRQRLEQPGLADGILLAGSRQITFGRLNRGVYIVARRPIAECIDGDGSARFRRYSSTSHAQFGVMLIDTYQFARSEEGSVGKEWGRTCEARWMPYI